MLTSSFGFRPQRHFPPGSSEIVEESRPQLDKRQDQRKNQYPLFPTSQPLFQLSYTPYSPENLHFSSTFTLPPHPTQLSARFGPTLRSAHDAPPWLPVPAAAQSALPSQTFQTFDLGLGADLFNSAGWGTSVESVGGSGGGGGLGERGIGMEGIVGRGMTGGEWMGGFGRVKEEGE